MSPRCVPCRRDFNSDEALQQHKRDSSVHKFDCPTCNRHFSDDKALAQHYQNAAVHARSFEHPSTPAMPPRPNRQKPSTKRRGTSTVKPDGELGRKWSMYPSLHSAVSSLLSKDALSFTFHEKDDDESCIDAYDTTITGRFVCRNTACLAVWTSGRIAISIRRYSKERYNARVYYQSCKRCGVTSEPRLDASYAERVAYRLKKWSGVRVERPPFEGQRDAPHRSDLCEGCKQGRCGEMGLR